MSRVERDGSGVRLLSHHVDALEVSCSVQQVPLLYGQFDELEYKLAWLRGRARHQRPAAAVPSGWHWASEGDEHPVELEPSGLRSGYSYALSCPDWVLLVASPRAPRARFILQFRGAYLLRAGAVSAYEAGRAWVLAHPMELVEGRAPETEPVWRISRVDLAADVAGVTLASKDLPRFTTRARNKREWHTA